MIEFRVITVVKDVTKYPQHREHTQEFPQLVTHVDDEVELFVVDTRNDGFWYAHEFFYCNDISRFIIDSNEDPEREGGLG